MHFLPLCVSSGSDFVSDIIAWMSNSNSALSMAVSWAEKCLYWDVPCSETRLLMGISHSGYDLWWWYGQCL